MIFSQRYHRALQDNRISVVLSDDVRRKLWAQLVKHDSPVGIRRNPPDNWIDNSSVLEEAAGEFLTEQGWDFLPLGSLNHDDSVLNRLRDFVLRDAGEYVFDIIELSLRWMEDIEQVEFRKKVNSIFEIHANPWRFTDGEFFKLDNDFVGARLKSTAHMALVEHRFAGAADEFAQARQDAASGDAKDAILYAAKSFESLMKAMTGLEQANADRLIKELIAQGFIDDLPETLRQGFAEQVLKTLPHLRNKLGGHGQGSTVVEVPAAYAELSLQLAAAFHNFLIAKHLQRQPPPPAPAEPTTSSLSIEDEIPF